MAEIVAPPADPLYTRSFWAQRIVMRALAVSGAMDRMLNSSMSNRSRELDPVLRPAQCSVQNSGSRSET